VRELEGELRQLSEEVSTDVLTQVANRRGLAQAFEAEAARADRAPDAEAGALAVGLIDIDNFKKLNDTLGHAAGDTALKALAAAVRDRLRPVDTVARFGGEEFVVLLPATPASEAQQVLTRLQRSLSAGLFMHDGHEVFVTFSAGVTAWRRGEALDWRWSVPTRRCTRPAHRQEPHVHWLSQDDKRSLRTSCRLAKRPGMQAGRGGARTRDGSLRTSCRLAKRPGMQARPWGSQDERWVPADLLSPGEAAGHAGPAVGSQDERWVPADLLSPARAGAAEASGCSGALKAGAHWPISRREPFDSGTLTAWKPSARPSRRFSARPTCSSTASSACGCAAACAWSWWNAPARRARPPPKNRRRARAVRARPHRAAPGAGARRRARDPRHAAPPGLRRTGTEAQRPAGAPQGAAGRAAACPRAVGGTRQQLVAARAGEPALEDGGRRDRPRDAGRRRRRRCLPHGGGARRGATASTGAPNAIAPSPPGEPKRGKVTAREV